MTSIDSDLQSAEEFTQDSMEEDVNDIDFIDDMDEYFDQGLIDSSGIEEPVSIELKREDTRGRLAIIYTMLTFLMFGLGFVVSILDAILNDTSIIANLSTVLPLISGIFLGTLGFVLGYYFKKMEDEKN